MHVEELIIISLQNHYGQCLQPTHLVPTAEYSEELGRQTWLKLEATRYSRNRKHLRPERINPQIED